MSPLFDYCPANKLNGTKIKFLIDDQIFRLINAVIMIRLFK